MSQSDLWLKFRQGDMKSLEQIYNENVDLLYGYGKKICQDENVLNDHIQDLFVYIWENRTKLGDAIVIKAYLMRALKNRIIDHYRKNSKIKMDGEVAHIRTQTASKEEEIILFETDRIRDENIKKAMNQLTDRQREIIYLKFTKNLSYEEIGDILEINYQSVRNLAHRAISELRKTMLVLVLIILLFL